MTTGCHYTRTTISPGGRWTWLVTSGNWDEDWTEEQGAVFDSKIVACIDDALEEQAPCARFLAATSEILVCIDHVGALETDVAWERGMALVNERIDPTDPLGDSAQAIGERK
ncbi:MAG: hypothetical protein M1121_06655 [Actinobacteria bacterium]|nr:hypothetical protein [Actinomycetota bacterium]